jgi:16S rRNA (guanine966-N2)-methyltransferase
MRERISDGLPWNMAGKQNKSTESSLRIIAGSWRGRRISFTSNTINLRPTGDRIRETLFNWLGPRVVDARCIDMYAGSGALGFEALSRGAREVVFIEKDRMAARQLKDNLHLLGPDRGHVRQGDALQLLRSSSGNWDIVFLDPPFEGTDYGNLCTLLEKSDRLAPEALIYIEMPRKLDWPALPENWQISKEKSAGQVRYALLTRGPSGADN